MATVSTRLSADKERFWRGHVEGWQRSGLSQRVYCKRCGLSLSTFTLWRQRLQAAGPGFRSAPRVEIVPLRQVARAPAAPIVVVLGGGQYRLELNEGFQVEALRAVVVALESRS
jgi:hypothetical protein